MNLLSYINHLGIKDNELDRFLHENPYFISLDMGKMLSFKTRMFLDLGISKKDIGLIFKEFPMLATKSLISTATKIRYLQENFHENLRVEPYFPKILVYNFNSFIKPRGGQTCSARGANVKAISCWKRATRTGPRCSSWITFRFASNWG